MAEFGLMIKGETEKSPDQSQVRAPQPESNRIVTLSPSQLHEELRRDEKRIKCELDSRFYTEGVEERVINILRRWSDGWSLPRASYNLGWIFAGLQAYKSGFWGETTTYYDDMFDRFDRVNELRTIRGGIFLEHYKSFKMRPSAKETEKAERQAEESAKRNMIDADAWSSGDRKQEVEHYEIPPTAFNLHLAKLEIGRLEGFPIEQLLPRERVISDFLKDLPEKERPRRLLKKVRYITKSERIERRNTMIREYFIHPLLEMLLWATGERIAVFIVQKIAARLFVAEARAAASLVSVEGRAFSGSGFEFRTEFVNPVNGEAVVIGRYKATGEVVTYRINIDTGAGSVLRGNGETLHFSKGRFELTKPAVPNPSAPLVTGKPVSPPPKPVIGTVAASPGGKQLLRPERALTSQELRDLRDLIVAQYKLPAPGIEFYQGYRNYAEYDAAYKAVFLKQTPSHKGSIPRTPAGFYDPNTKLIHFPPGANVHTMVHETLHWIGGKSNVRKHLDKFMNEGLTDWMVRRKLGERAGKHAYDVNVQFVRDLAGYIGEEPLEMAFLHGQWGYLRQAMNKQAGSLQNAQKAYILLRDGQNINNLAEVRRLLRMNGPRPIPKGP